MGTFNWPMAVANMDRDKSVEVEAAVGTHATFTALPASLLKELGVSSTRQVPCDCGDGRIVQMDLGEAWVTANGITEISQVIFGEDDCQPLIGMVILGELCLGIDAARQRLVPTNAIWY